MLRAQDRDPTVRGISPRRVLGAASLRTVVVFQVVVQSDWFVNRGIGGVQELVWQATAPFRQLHPGIDLRLYSTTVNPVGEVIAGP